MPLTYFYYHEGGRPIFLFPGPRRSFVRKELYTIKDEEVTEMAEFIRTMKIPFKKDFLKLAFETFQLSYQIPNDNLFFLVLMMSLEALLNPGGGEIKHRLSRNSAILVGTNRDDSQYVFGKMKGLYDIRSKIVHAREPVQVAKEELQTLGSYVRKAIKEVYDINRSKILLMDLLDSCGFGERPWRK